MAQSTFFQHSKYNSFFLLLISKKSQQKKHHHQSATATAASTDPNSASITHNQKTFMGEKVCVIFFCINKQNKKKLKTSSKSIIRYKCLKAPSICCFGKEEDNKLPLLMFGSDGSFHHFLIDTKKTEGPPVIVKKNDGNIKTWS